MSSPPKPPVADRHVESRTLHGTLIEDPYAWLRRRDDPRVIAHLESENAYAEVMTASQTALRDELYDELVGRIPPEDESVPVHRGSYLYGERLAAGAQYAVHWRRKVKEVDGEVHGDGPEEVVLDVETLAAEHDYLSLGLLRISPDERRAAYLLDVDGSERYRLRIKDLESGEMLGDRIDGVALGCEWAADGQTLFYITRDEAQRPCRLYRHRLGEEPSRDELVFEETDERFFLSLEKTRSGQFLVLSLGTHSTSEVHVLEAERPEEPPRLVAQRQAGIEWQLDHWTDGEGPGRFMLRTNLGARLFRLLSAPVQDPTDLREEVAERPDVVLDGVDCWRHHLVLSIRHRGLSGLEVHPMAGGDPHHVELEEEVGVATLVDNAIFDTPWVRFAFQSPVTPRSIFDYHASTRERRLRKRTHVEGHDPERYVSRRLSVLAKDGVEVPVSWVERRDRKAGGPVLLYAYGSYGTPLEPRFSSARLSLLDRGFAYAIVHARGGGELGRPWYEAAKLGCKQRTFDDVIDVADHLVARRLATPHRLLLRGGSAGGLMVGAVINQRPELFHGALAEVPFVDVLHTMLDPSIPLTVIEFEEWGNPGESAEAFAWIRGYSPYENVRAAAYPHLLVTAGLNDPRVQYWEPAKWVARLRHRKIDENLLLLRVDMGSGHGGASGRYNSLRQEAMKLAFLIECLERGRRDLGNPLE